uniref:Glycerol-3-phosphate acyltransferase 2, mitochondrial n=1 Tax=Buteo japonicus TaxID=224669 RepID=A0A8C0HKK3_9AVES
PQPSSVGRCRTHLRALIPAQKPLSEPPRGKLEIFIPFLGKYRPFSGHCCQTCTPKSWVRAWLWKLWLSHAAPFAAQVGKLRQGRVAWMRSVGGVGGSHGPLRLLTCLFSCRLCNWVLLKLLNRLFLNVQLHQGQLEMVLRAARMSGVPLVFLSTHKSQLDGLLLSFVLFSQGLGVPRVTVGGQVCSPHLRARLFGLGTCLWAACWAVCRNLGCVRVDFAQPFSLQVRQRGFQLLPGSTPALEDGVACSAVMAVGITSALLLLKHREVRDKEVSGFLVFWSKISGAPPAPAAMQRRGQLLLLFLQGVFLSRLMLDFAWLLEEILLRQRDVGFSGQLRALVQHSLVLLRARLALYHLSPVGDVLVVPEVSAEALRELGHRSAAILPVFASEAVGGTEGGLGDRRRRGSVTLGPSVTRLSRQLTARTRSPSAASRYSGCPPMRPSCLRGRVRVVSPNSGFPRPQLSEPQGSPGLLLFLCRLLSPMLRTYARAVAFLDRPSWPQPGRTPSGWATASPTTLAPLGLAFGETEVQPKLPCRPGSALRPERGCTPLGPGDGGI